MPNLYDLGSDGSDVCWDCGKPMNFVCHNCLGGAKKSTTYEQACEIEKQNMERRYPLQNRNKWLELPCQLISSTPLLTVKVGSVVLRLKEHIPWSKSQNGVVLLKEKLGNTLKDKFEIVMELKE